MKTPRDRVSEDISRLLPAAAYLKSWNLTWLEMEIDPVYLRSEQGKDLYEWDYIPSLTEVDEVCAELGAQ